MHPAIAAPVLSVQPSSKSVEGASAFSLDIAISDAADLFAFQFDLGFNQSVLSATGTAEGPFLQSGGSTFFIGGVVDNAGGTIAGIADALAGPAGVSGSGILATVDFIPTGNGTSPISLFNVMLFDSTLNGITATIQDGRVTVVPEPSTFVLLAVTLLGMWGVRRRTASLRYGRGPRTRGAGRQ
jgi:hypothetical protein